MMISRMFSFMYVIFWVLHLLNYKLISINISKKKNIIDIK